MVITRKTKKKDPQKARTQSSIFDEIQIPEMEKSK